ncbi:hypothetical protein POM88_021882 [Heracleum sosnowskyi]|uniref:Uncharacterized protein n=1 Tax=Heracleum sosnowskyi TaxID=360622 RepID=A0AAD8IGR5_9APIA|nr:hypothetical protein POM88_021882 [Heracleum sosnowskyi]
MSMLTFQLCGRRKNTVPELLFPLLQVNVSGVCKQLEQAKKDLKSVNELLGNVKDYAQKLESESILWKRKTLSLIDDTKTRATKLTESTLVISNFDIVTTYVFRGNGGALMPAASVIQNDILGLALYEAQHLDFEPVLTEHYSLELRVDGGSLEKNETEPLAKDINMVDSIGEREIPNTIYLIVLIWFG